MKNEEMDRIDVSFTLCSDGSVDIYAFGRRYSITGPILHQSKFLMRLCTLRDELKDVRQRANITRKLFTALTNYKAGKKLLKEVGETVSPLSNYKRGSYGSM